METDRFAPVLAELAPLAERFAARGHRLHLVGGTVRDLSLGLEAADVDIDLTTDARPPEIKQCLEGWADAIWTQGERFGTIGAQRRLADPVVDGDGVAEARIYEITTHRSEAYTDRSRKPHVTFSDDLVADLSRRDFTINAMALELTAGPEPRLVDPFGGRADLRSRRLRTPLDPEISFSDDPLRMLRAARFVAAYEMAPVEGLTQAVGRLRHRLAIVSPERIRVELDKLMVLECPSTGLRFLIDTGLVDHILPELVTLRGRHHPGHRDRDLLAHTLAVVDGLRPTPDPSFDLRIARLAVLFHGHGDAAASMARSRMRALRYSNADIDAAASLVARHRRPDTLPASWSDAEVRRWVRGAGPVLAELHAVIRSDATTFVEDEAVAAVAAMDALDARIAELAATEDLAAIGPEIDGHEVMAHLGIPAGPLVREALEVLLEVRITEGLIGRDRALARLDEWFGDRSVDQPP